MRLHQTVPNHLGRPVLQPPSTDKLSSTAKTLLVLHSCDCWPGCGGCCPGFLLQTARLACWPGVPRREDDLSGQPTPMHITTVCANPVAMPACLAVMQTTRLAALAWSAAQRRSWTRRLQRWSTPSSTTGLHSTCVLPQVLSGQQSCSRSSAWLLPWLPCLGAAAEVYIVDCITKTGCFVALQDRHVSRAVCWQGCPVWWLEGCACCAAVCCRLRSSW